MRVCKRCDTPVEAERVIEEYSYYCPECDENLYEFETKGGEDRLTSNIVTVDEIKEKVAAAGFHYIADRAVSKHPDDWYLRIVMAFRERPRQEYVTWVYNASSGGLTDGRYTEDRRIAMDTFHSRY
jgi:hypothetical protein